MLDQIKVGLAAMKLSKKWRQAVADGWKPGISLKKALSTFAIFAVGAVVMGLDEATVTSIVGDAFPPEVAKALVGVLVFALRFAQNAWKVKAATLAAKAAGAAVLLALLAPSPMYAQEAPAQPSLSAGTLEVDLSGWTLAIVTRQEKREVAGGRAVVDYAISERLWAFTRIDITGAQDFGSIKDFGEYSAFRAVETYGGLRYQIHSAGVAVAAVGGTSWSIEGKDGPLNPRMATALLLLRVPLPGGGHAYVGGGHRGPVGGAALVASVTYPAGPTRLLIEYDLPLTTIDGQPRPGVLKTGVAVPIKRFRWAIR